MKYLGVADGGKSSAGEIYVRYPANKRLCMINSGARAGAGLR